MRNFILNLYGRGELQSLALPFVPTNKLVDVTHGFSLDDARVETSA